jgi:hypothetical protein
VTSLNAAVEDSFAILPIPEGLDADIVPKLEEVADLLHSIILACVMSEDAPQDVVTDDEAESTTKKTVESVKESDMLVVEDDSEMKNLSELLRACKNLLRSCP